MNIENRRWNAAASVDPAVVPDSDVSRRRRLVWIVAGLLLVAAIAAVLFARRHGAAEVTTPASLPSVSVLVPGRVPVANAIVATGSLSAKRTMPVGVAGEGGMINRVLVDAGSWVRAGQTLATIDPAVQAAQVAQMRAAYDSATADAKLAQSDLDRAQALAPRGFISKAEIDAKIATRDAANAKVKLAAAQYREAAARLGRLDIRAPLGGLVLQRSVEPGQVVSSGSPALFTIAMDGMFEMQAKLAEQDLAAVHVGMPAQVTPVGATQPIMGSVWQVSPVIDPTTRQGVVRIAVAYTPAVRPGGFATARFSADRTEAPVVPESAILSDGQGNYVYLVDDQNRVVRRNVKIGDVSDRGIAVLSGLQGNERVVSSAGAFLNPGEKVVPDLKRGG